MLRPMALQTEPYEEQAARWPRAGRHILAQFDEESVVVYQAYRPAIGSYAAEHGRFGGEFSLSRMSWIKPNFLWMMYRSGWGTKVGQEVILAVWLRRDAFDQILAAAVPSSFWRRRYDTDAAWKADVTRSDVRLQWDPDHGPRGARLQRRAVQLGLRRAALASYAEPWVLRIEDVSPFVEQQRRVLEEEGTGALLTPRERVYPVRDPAVVASLGLDAQEE